MALPCASEQAFAQQLDSSATTAAKDLRAVPPRTDTSLACADVYVIKDYRAHAAYSAHYALDDHAGLVDRDEWRRVFPRRHRAVGDAGQIGQHFRTLVITQATDSDETQLLDLPLAKAPATTTVTTKQTHNRLSRSGKLYFLLGLIFGVLVPFLRKWGRQLLSPYINK